MKITTVSYSKKFPYAPYLNFDIGFEAELDETDNPIKVLDTLKQLAENYYKSQSILPQEQNYVPDTNVGNILQEPESQSITPPKLSQKELITQEISNAKTPKQLQEWKLLSDKYPDLKQIFEEKLNELTK